MPTIVASSIGFRGLGRGPLDWSPGPIYRYAADLAGAGDRPRICFLNQATGDSVALRSGIYAAFAGTGFEVSHLALLDRKSVVEGKRVDLGGRRIIKKK